MEPEQLYALGEIIELSSPQAGQSLGVSNQEQRADHLAGEVNPVARAKRHVTVRGITRQEMDPIRV